VTGPRRGTDERTEARRRRGRSRSVVRTFLLVTSAASVPFWALGTVVDGSLIGGLPVSALMFLAPVVGVVAACPAQRWRETSQRLRGLTARAAATAVAADLLWVPVMPVVVGVAVLLGPSRADIGAITGVAVMAALVALVLAAAAEELGWTWLLARELRKVSAWRVALLSGAIWAGLHVVPWVQGGHDLTWIAAQAAFTVLFRFVIVTADRRTSRIGVAVVLHATYNTAWVVLADAGAAYSPAVTTIVLVPVAATIAICARQQQRLRPRRGTRPTGALQARPAPDVAPRAGTPAA